MCKALFRLLGSWMLLCSFFWSEEQKDIEELSNKVDLAFAKENWSEAIENLKAILKQAQVSEKGAPIIPWSEYIDTALKLSFIYEKQGRNDEALAVIHDLLSKNPPVAQTPKILLVKARLAAPLSSPERSYLLFQQIAKDLPMELWSREDLFFFHALSYSLDEYFDGKLKKAKRYFVTGYIEEAICLYEEVLMAIEHRFFPKASLNPELLKKKIKYALAECHFAKADYSNTLAYTEGDETLSSNLDRERLYLMALCYKNQHDYEKALDCLEDYTQHVSPSEHSHFEPALFEIGFHYYQHGQHPKAAEYFQRLLGHKGVMSKAKLLGCLYLSRIYLEANDFGKGLDLLLLHEPFFQEKEPLHAEFQFLLAEAYWGLGQFTQACIAYERAKPSCTSQSFHYQAFCKLALCHLHLYQETIGPGASQHALLAEKMLQTLLDKKDRGFAALNLAKLYLQQLRRHEKITPVCLPDFLHTYKQTFDLSQEHEALLIEAACLENSDLKLSLLEKATLAVYASLPTYLNAWYEKGLHALQLSLIYPNQKKKQLHIATSCFEKALSLCVTQTPTVLAKILKLGAKAHFFSNAPQEALLLLRKLQQSCIEFGPDKEETLYLIGLVSSHLADPSELLAAETHFKELIALPDQGLYLAEALSALGQLYFNQGRYQEAFNTYCELEKLENPLAAEGAFWAIESLEKLESQPNYVIQKRRDFHEKYPFHQKAAEAYFKIYPYVNYLTGKPEALAHLANFSILFPHSPLGVMVHTLIGLNTQDRYEAMQAYEKAIHLLPLVSIEGLDLDANTLHFYYEAQYQLAVLKLQDEASREEGLRLLVAITDDFKETNHPHAGPLMAKNKVPAEYAQAVLAHAKALVEDQHKTRAEQVLFGLLIKYREGGITENLFLALTWKEMGKMAMGDRDFKTAAHCFDVALESGESALADEQKIQIWLYQSTCHRQTGDLEKAMRLLSKIINSDRATPLRIEAMFLRAEIYQLQGKPELALRQLEAVVKKGGDWAELAQQKIRRLL